MVWYLSSKAVGSGGRDYNIDALDGDISLIECEDMSQDDGIAIRPGGSSVQAGKPIKPEHMIKSILWRSQRKVPDICSPFIANAVSDEFREIVEDLEPSVHQWLPIEFVGKKNNHLADRWYFIPCNRIDSVDEENTTLVLYKGSIWTHPTDLMRRGEEHLLPVDYDPREEITFAFNEEKVAGLHAWKEKRLVGNPLMVSNELAAALKAADLSGLELRKAESV
jgi:hypothetical protein